MVDRMPDKTLEEGDALIAKINSANRQRPVIMELTKQKFDSIFNGLSLAQQATYGAVPMAEGWSTQRIIAELARCGTRTTAAECAKVLKVLSNNGLIMQPASGCYQRVHVAGAASVQVQQKQAPTKAQPGVDALEMLGRIAKNLRSLSDDARALANEIEDAALVVEEQLAAKDKKAANAKQLIDLIKSLEA